MDQQSGPGYPTADPGVDPTAAPASSNVVRYERRDGQRVTFAGAATTSEVIFIDENTPTPPLPERRLYIPIDRRRNDEDVFYIGPE